LEASTLHPFEAFITIAVLYLVMTLLLSFFVRVIEARTRLPG
jgi:ABC-type amino acid transport system permease subunit